MDNGTKVKKTRYRVPTVCTVCRRRKMKCDKEKPYCSSCVKNNTTNLCFYEEQPWAASNSEQQKLKDQIFQLQQHNNELKKLLSFNVKNSQNFSSGSSSSGNSPFSSNFNFILPDQPINDPVMELTEDFDLLLLKESKMAHYGATSYMAVVSQDPILKDIMSKYLDQQKLGVNFDKFFLYDQQKLDYLSDGCHLVGSHAIDGTSVFESTLKKDHQELVNSINDILPPPGIISALIDHFFQETYVFIPFIDEDSFRENMEELIFTNVSGKAELRLKNFTLLVSVAVLLCILRFSFISLPFQRPKQVQNETVKVIMKSGFQIGPNFIEYAKACMGNASTLRKPTLKHITALLILRLYRYYAPEDGDESTDSTIFLALVVQMARMQGLHRDPSRFSMITNHATIKTWRKIWCQLMFLDAMQALQFGCPLLIDDEYDTLLPVSNHDDSTLEKSCIESLKKQHEVTLLVREIVNLCSKIKIHPKRSELEMSIKSVEFLLLKYRPMRDLTNLEDPNESFIMKSSKVRDLTMKVHLYSLHYIAYYLLLLKCEPSEVGVMQRFSNAAIESALILFRLCYEFGKDPAQFTKDLNFEIFLGAAIFDSSKRALQALCSLCIRDLSNLYNFQITVQNFVLQDSEGLDQWLTPIANDITVGEHLLYRIEKYTQFCTRLSNKYYVCWRISFIQKLFNDYIEFKYPERISSLYEKIRRSGNAEQNFEVGSLEVDENTHNFWSQFVDDANQSQFDYLAPDLNKYDGLNDPFLSDAYFMSGQLNFQDYNSIFGSMADNTDSTSSTGNAQSISADEVSPGSISSNQSDKTKNQTPNFLFENGLLPENNDLMKDMMNPTVNENDLAMHVARSMFGDSSNVYENSDKF